MVGSQRCDTCCFRSHYIYAPSVHPATYLGPTRPAAFTPSLISILPGSAPLSRHHVKTRATNERGNEAAEPSELETWEERGGEGCTGTCHLDRCRRRGPASARLLLLQSALPQAAGGETQGERRTLQSLNVVQAAPAGKGNVSRSPPQGFEWSQLESWSSSKRPEFGLGSSADKAMLTDFIFFHLYPEFLGQ